MNEEIKNKFKRDDNGLLEGINYIYNEDGSINWRAMIKPEHLVVFREKRQEVEEKYGKKIEELDLTQVDDKYLLILLSGIKYLARIRNYISIIPKVDYVSSQRCVVTTVIKWAPNFETNNAIIEFGDVGSASIENTFSFAQQYLEPIAANRAFVRAVRNFLGINIVAYDEVGPNKKEEENFSSGFKPSNLLEQKVESLGLTFEKFRDGIITKYKDKIKSDPEKWESFHNIPAKDIYILLGILENSK